MKRALVWMALLLGGCGVAPMGESVQADTYPCPLGDLQLGSVPRVTTSSVDPWGHSQGVIVAYDQGDGTYLIIGVDQTYASIRWWMDGGTGNDVENFEAYPQSLRNCDPTKQPSSSPTSGTPPKAPPENGCAPTNWSSDARTAYYFGPYLTSPMEFCEFGSGGCYTCSHYGWTCGSHVNNCGWTITCGPACSCPCGGTYPRCLTCSPY